MSTKTKRSPLMREPKVKASGDDPWGFWFGAAVALFGVTLGALCIVPLFTVLPWWLWVPASLAPWVSISTGATVVGATTFWHRTENGRRVATYSGLSLVFIGATAAAMTGAVSRDASAAGRPAVDASLEVASVATVFGGLIVTSWLVGIRPAMLRKVRGVGRLPAALLRVFIAKRAAKVDHGVSVREIRRAFQPGRGRVVHAESFDAMDPLTKAAMVKAAGLVWSDSVKPKGPGSGTDEGTPNSTAQTRPRPGIRPARVKLDGNTGNGHLIYVVDPLAKGTFGLDQARWAQVLEVAYEQVQVARGKIENEIVVTITRTDPLMAYDFRWTATAGRTHLDGIRVGGDERGRPVVLDVRDTHTLIVGGTGSGKTTLLRTIGAELRQMTDVRLIVLDPLKRGEPFRCLNADRVAATPAEIRRAVIDLQAEMHRRYDVRAEHAVTADEPMIAVLADEFPVIEELGPDVQKAFRELMAQARGAAIHIFAATQRATNAMIDSTTRANMLQTICLRTKGVAEIGYAFGDNTLPTRMDASQFPAKVGMMAVATPDDPEPVRARFAFADEQTVARACAGHGSGGGVDHAPAPPPRHLHAVPAPTVEIVEDTWDTVTPPAASDAPATAKQQILKYLARFGAESHAELGAALNISKQRVSQVMRKLEASGEVAKVNGRWTTTKERVS